MVGCLNPSFSVSFPTVSPLQTTSAGGYDIFIAKIGEPCTSAEAIEPMTSICIPKYECDITTGEWLPMYAVVGASCSTDNNVCNGIETCDGNGECLAGMALVVNNDNNSCTQDYCDPITGIRHDPLLPGKECSDTNACTTGDVCNASAVCVGTAINVDDGDQCTTDSCDPKKGTIAHVKVPAGTMCSDGNACTTGETCNAGGKCKGGAKVNASDGNSCTDDYCNTTTGAITHTIDTTNFCSDSNPCTSPDSCTSSGTCIGSSAYIDDGNSCTTDTCNPSTGVKHEILPAGTICSDGSTCTDNVCNNSGVCLATNLPNGHTCSVSTGMCGICLEGMCAEPPEGWEKCEGVPY